MTPTMENLILNTLSAGRSCTTDVQWSFFRAMVRPRGQLIPVESKSEPDPWKAAAWRWHTKATLA
jgi:hypothetical protein